MSLFGKEKGQIVAPYKGPLSSYAEWHAMVIGAYHSLDPKSEGIPKELSDPDSYRYNADVDKEIHMAKYGYIGTEYLKYFALGLVVFLK